MSELREIVESTSGRTREVLEDFVHTFSDTIKEKRRLEKKVEHLAHDLRLLKKRIFGSSSERMSCDLQDQEDLPLFDEIETCEQQVELEAPIESEESEQKASKKKPGRKPLPKHLPRSVVEHDLSDEEKQCQCGADMEYIGSQKSEQLNYQPAIVSVIEHHCKKYVCPCCREKNKKDLAVTVPMKTAKRPADLIPKSIASNELLAQIVINKFCDHLPLYRQENIFKRYGVELSRKTMSEWMLKVGEAVIPLINLLQEKILEYDVAYSDETTVQVLNEPGRRAQSKSYMWCFLGGRPEEPVIIYQYHLTRKGSIAEEFFEGYSGALHCDGYGGYQKLIASKDIVGINCMAHVRRKFIEALPQGKEKGVSGYVVKELRKLYQIESRTKEISASAEVVYKMRQENAKPILLELKKYLDQKAQVVPPSSKVGEAIQYTRKRWNYLITYLEDGRYEIDNNRAERAIKPFVMGRKAWLFSNSPSGAHTSSRLFSLIETAKANDIEPLSYLLYIFDKLPTCCALEDYEALLPWRVKDKTKKLSN